MYNYIKNFLAWKNLSLWSKGRHSWLWILWSMLKSPWQQQIFLGKRKGVTEIWTHDHWIQSQLRLPLDHKFMKNVCKVKKKVCCILSSSNFFNFITMEYKTHSSQMCRILESILSSSFQPCNSILTWKLLIWMCRQMQWPPSRGNKDILFLV